MAIEFTWYWGPLRVENTENQTPVIAGINWKCVAVDSDSGVMGMESGFIFIPDSDTTRLLSVEDVTGEIIDGWISSYLNKQDVEGNCTQHVQSLLSPMIKTVEISAAAAEVLNQS